jgi:condensin complex subunit 2
MRGRRVNPGTNAEGKIDENFWAQAAADQAAGRSGEDGNEGESSYFRRILGDIGIYSSHAHFADGDGQAIPFNTQFFHDDFDDDGDGPGFDDGDDGGGIGSVVPGAEGDVQDLMATLVGSSRRVRPQYVIYTKKAKRVDVRKLKENIWKSLDIEAPKSQSPDEFMVCILTFSGFSSCIISDIADCIT